MRRFCAIALVLVCTILCAAASASPIRLRSGNIEPGAIGAQSASETTPAEGYYVIQFAGPVEQAWKDGLGRVGVALLDYIPDFAYLCKLTREQLAAVRKLEYVSQVVRLRPEHRIDPGLKQRSDPMCEVLIRLFAPDSMGEFAGFVKSRGGVVLGDTDPSGLMLRVRIAAAALDGITRLEYVEWVELYDQPRLSNNVAQQITTVDTFRNRTGVYGAGQTIAIADTGLDTGSLASIHPDFADRIAKTYALRRPNDWSDLHGHGTHVAGAAAGSGQASGGNPSTHTYSGSFAGVAPEASIVMQSIGDGTGYVYPPLDLTQLFQPTYDDGARIHTNSWGSSAQGKYTINSQQVDSFAWAHKDFVMVFAAGNDAVDSNSDGVTDSGSIDAPATAKNCITVGASESLRTTGRITTYGFAWGFLASPIYGDYISNNSGGMVAWSGRGPCEDGRYKPDICAPGTNIISARSQAVMNTSWAIYNSHYVYWGGTSMSTPMVAGAAALIRQYYASSRGITPSSALVKATLLNAATDMYPGQYGSGTSREIRTVRPNSQEGWGRLNMSDCIDPPAPRVVDFVDDGSGLSTGQSRQYQFYVIDSTLPLAVTLVWTDPPGSPLAAKELVNDLHLSVLRPDGITLHKGNGGLYSDTVNNVESVDISSPPTGVYTVTITGYNVPQGPQPFALVVSGKLPGGYVSGTARTATGKAISGATITVTGGSSPKTTSTGAGGDYTLHLQPGTYTITPTLSGWTFSPTSRTVTVADAGIVGLDFTGSAPAASVSGTVTEMAGGVTNYELESVHPYYNNSDIIYTIAAHPSASQTRVHFSDIDVQEGFDYIEVLDAGGSVVQSITGAYSDVWSNWVTGNVLRIHLTSDSSETFWGFYVDGYETDKLSVGALSGVTVTTSPGGASAISGGSGAYTIPSLEPVSYNVMPTLAHWRFNPQSVPVSLQPGVNVTGLNFEAYAPASVSGDVRTGVVSEHASSVASAHPYPDDANITYTVKYIGADPCTRIRAHFSKIETETDYDFVIVKKPTGEIVDTFTGMEFGSGIWSSWVAGNELKIVLNSDPSYDPGNPNAYWGFAVDKYMIAGSERGVQGVQVITSPFGLTTATASNGTYVIPAMDAGMQYGVSASKPFWDITPSLRTINAVSGVDAADTSFFAIASPMPGIAYAKSLADGEEVLFEGAVVTAGAGTFTDFFYAESEDRSSGIRVLKTAHGIAAGTKVDIRGTMGTLTSGERFIQAITVTASGSGSVKPLGVTNKALGGGDSGYDAGSGSGQAGVMGGDGANNIGLLVRIWGKVTEANAGGFFYVDDGSAVADGTVYQGVRVYAPGLAIPAKDSVVAVTGIASCDRYLGNVVRAILPRSQSDITSLSP